MISIGHLRINQEGRETSKKWAEVSDQKENTWCKWPMWLGGTKSFAMRVLEGLEVVSHGQEPGRAVNDVGEDSRGGGDFQNSVKKRELRTLCSLEGTGDWVSPTHSPTPPKGFSIHLTGTDDSLSQTQS